ncbi:MAG TPA: hypothetical protein PK993_02920 [Clostridia bacterium]|nr:hypothetical protein [Clostridia bacterium]
MDNSKSLVVHKKGIFQKIQDLIKKIFKKESNSSKESDSEMINNSIENNIEIKENFRNDLKKNTNNDIKELINKIQIGEVVLEDKQDNELSEIEEKLVNYLKQLEQEIQIKRSEISSLEKAIITTSTK